MKLIKHISRIFNAKGGGEAWQESARQRIVVARELACHLEAGSDFIALFRSLPEVFFPIDFIASRIAKASFEVKRYKDDSVVWSRNKMLAKLARPNCVMTWSELVYTHFVYKLATGNAYLRAAMSEAFEDGKKYRLCDHYWPLPADRVKVEASRTYDLPIYGICESDTQATTTGLVRLKCANVPVSPVSRQVQVWNRMVERNRGFASWCASGDCPVKGIATNRNLLAPINRFNL